MQTTELHLKHPQPETHFRDVGGSICFQVISISTNRGFRLLALLVKHAQPIICIGSVFRFGGFEVGVEFADGRFAFAGLLKEHSPTVVCQAPELLAPQFQIGLVMLRGSLQRLLVWSLLAGGQHRVVAFRTPECRVGAMWRLWVLLNKSGKVSLR